MSPLEYLVAHFGENNAFIGQVNKGEGSCVSSSQRGLDPVSSKERLFGSYSGGTVRIPAAPVTFVLCGYIPGCIHQICG